MCSQAFVTGKEIGCFQTPFHSSSTLDWSQLCVQGSLAPFSERSSSGHHVCTLSLSSASECSSVPGLFGVRKLWRCRKSCSF